MWQIESLMDSDWSSSFVFHYLRTMVFLCVQCQVYGPVMDDRNDLRGRFLLVYYKEVAIAFHEDVRFMQTTKRRFLSSIDFKDYQ